MTIFPLDNVWNTDVSELPLHPFSEDWKANFGNNTPVHNDFASGQWEGKDIGIPVNEGVPMSWGEFKFLYHDDSDLVPYPTDGVVEQGSDQHLIHLDTSTGKLYELFNVDLTNMTAGSGAVFDVTSNGMRREGLTSADAAGLAILPGLVRYHEVAAGEIPHAIRFTVEKTRSYDWPGSHLTSGEAGKVVDFQPPLGARFRLRKDFDISKLGSQAKVVAKAMQCYGILLADNGSDLFLSGEPHPSWDNDDLATLKLIKGKDLEAVDSSNYIVSKNSYQMKSAVKADVLPKLKAPSPEFITELKAKLYDIQILMAKWGY